MTAGLAAGVSRGLDPVDILKLACAAGTANVTRHGLGSASDDLIDTLAERVEIETRIGGVRMTDLPRIVMTNDDGIDSPGLLLFAKELATEYEVVVAAPATNMSGAGTGIGRFDPETGVELNTVEMDGFIAHTIAGPPGLAVMAAALGAFGRAPDLVVSGINAGINTGHSVIHSGTVGGALTARTFGTRGIAISLAPSDPWHWETAIAVGVSAVRWMLSNEGSPHVLNVNVPAVPIEQVAGTKWAELDEFGYFQIATTDSTDQATAIRNTDRNGGRRPRQRHRTVRRQLRHRDPVVEHRAGTASPRSSVGDLEPLTSCYVVR